MFVSRGRMSPAQADGYRAAVNGFRRLSADEAAAIDARRRQVVTGPGQDVGYFARRMAVDALLWEQFLLLNRLDPGALLTPGQKIKLAVDDQAGRSAGPPWAPSSLACPA